MSDTSQTPIALEARTAQAERLHSPSAARNRAAIAEVLAPRLPEGARVLEIGSGTGEHAVTVCQARPDIHWQPSDPDAASRASQAAWAPDAGGGLAAPLALDLTRPGWDEGLGPFDALVCINVIHISPWRVAEALAEAAGSARLVPGGLVYLYGPYREGETTAPSNLDFDRSLKSRDPAWGVRDREAVEALFAAAGLVRELRADMPANNLSLVFRKPGTA